MNQSPDNGDGFASPPDAAPAAWWDGQITAALAAHGITAADGSKLLVTAADSPTAPYPPDFTAWDGSVRTSTGDDRYTVFYHCPSRSDTAWTAMSTAVFCLAALVKVLRRGDDSWGLPQEQR